MPFRFVILLTALSTLLSACALLFPKHPDDDPVARVALQEYTQDQNRRKEQLRPSRSLAQEHLIKQAIASDQLAIGMRSDEVESVWGHPREIEEAGEPGSGNQKWIYPGGVMETWNMQPSRFVYFENGLVVGWEGNHRF